MIVDIIVGAVMVISAVIAFLRGFIREVLTIIGVVGGLVAAYVGGGPLSDHVDKWLGVQEGVEPERLFGMVPYPVLSDIISYGLIFIAVLIALSVISHMLAESAKSLGLGAIDRTLGVIFGLVRGLLLMALLYLPAHILVDKETKAEWFEGSRSYFYLEKTAEWMADFLPESKKEKLKEEAGTLTETMGTREKLKSMDVLQNDEKEEQEMETNIDSEGYDSNFRENMDQLFEEKTPEQGYRGTNE